MKVATFCYSWDAFHMHPFPLEPKLEATKLKKAAKFKCICAESVKVATILNSTIRFVKFSLLFACL